MKKYLYVISGLLACFFLTAQNTLADFISYESLPTANSPHVSHHNAGGPVLADDFFSTFGGAVVGVEWWGAAPLSSGGNDSWEVTFHSDAGGQPFATPGTGGISQHLLNATGSDTDGDGIFHYVAAWSPADVFLLANSTYWFSVANASGSNWTWALGAAPTIGSETWDAVVSTGAGSPHFGPWGALVDDDFAFRIILAPEPGSIALIAFGLLGLAWNIRRHFERT